MDIREHTFNPSRQQAEAGGSLGVQSLVYRLNTRTKHREILCLRKPAPPKKKRGEKEEEEKQEEEVEEEEEEEEEKKKQKKRRRRKKGFLDSFSVCSCFFFGFIVTFWQPRHPLAPNIHKHFCSYQQIFRSPESELLVMV